MRSPDGAASESATVPADHAGSMLCRLLIYHPDVVDIEILGQAEVLDGTITYSLGVMLPGGRELYIDVEDAPAHLPPPPPPPPRARRRRTHRPADMAG